MSPIEIDNLYLAGFLKAKGFPLLSLQQAGRYTVFLFSNSDLIRQAIEGYYNNTATIEARSFALALKEIKELIHSPIRGKYGK